jgi:hypothetical protein
VRKKPDRAAEARAVAADVDGQAISANQPEIHTCPDWTLGQAILSLQAGASRSQEGEAHDPMACVLVRLHTQLPTTRFPMLGPLATRHVAAEPLIHIPMLYLLLLSLSSFVSSGAEPQPVPALFDLPELSPVCVVGLEPSSDRSAPAWILPPQLTVLLTDSEQPAKAGGPYDELLVLSAAQDGTGCTPNGNVDVEYIHGELKEPVKLTFTIPFPCPGGVIIMRTVTHSVVYQTVTERTTRYRSSSKPGVECSPLVTERSFTQVASESWSYGPGPICPGECCLLSTTTSKLEYSDDIYQGKVQQNSIKIICPDGKPGTQTTITETYLRNSRWVTVETYIPTCPGAVCPPSQVEGLWSPSIHATVVKVTNDCQPEH